MSITDRERKNEHHHSTKTRLFNFSQVLEKVGKFWVFVEIVKACIEIIEVYTGFASLGIHQIFELLLVVVENGMNIILIHLIFKFASLLMCGIAKLIEQNENK